MGWYPPGMATVEVVWGTVAAVLAGEPDPLALLAAGERERVAGLKHAAVRDRFIAGRVLLRGCLAARIAASPRELRFSFGAHGKPLLDPTPPGAPAFNLAHTADVVAVALAPAVTVGIDLEAAREVGSALRIAERRFAPAEADWLAGLQADHRSRAFLRLWTAKEAVLKALGSGVAGGLATIELAAAKGGELRVTSWPPDASGPWTLLETELRPGLLAAVVLPGGPWQLQTSQVRRHDTTTPRHRTS